MTLKPVFADVKEFSYNDLYLHAVAAPAGHKILNSCLEIAQMLIEKNILDFKHCCTILHYFHYV